MQHADYTGSPGSASNVYRLPNAPKVLRSRKPRNRLRAFIETFCSLKPKSRLKVLKVMITEYSRDTEGDDKTTKPPYSHKPASFYISSGISRDLWEKYIMSIDEARKTERRK